MADAKRSVLENATDADIAKMPLSKDIDELPSQFGELLKARRSVSTFNPSFNEYGTDKFMVQPKPYDINADIMNTANIAANEVNEEYTIGSGIDARRGYREGKLLNEAKFKELILNRIATNSAARRAYLKGAESTPENLELAAAAAYEAVKDKFSLKSREGNYIDPSGREISLHRTKAAISDSYEDKDDTKETDLIYRQKLIGRVFEGDQKALDEVKAYLPSGSKFELGTSVNSKDSKGGYKLVRLSIPAGEYNGNYLPEIREDISFSLGDPMNRLNAIISQYTGEKISPSKLNTVGGKPRGETFNVTPSSPRTGQPAKSTTLSTIKSLVGKKGYEGYTEKELIAYYKSLGYQIK